MKKLTLNEFYGIIEDMQRKPAMFNFIEAERIKGTSDQEIIHQLLDAGWQMDIVKHAMEAQGKPFERQPILPKKFAPYNFLFSPWPWMALIVIIVLMALFI